jgi:hypothetical protein
MSIEGFDSPELAATREWPHVVAVRVNGVWEPESDVGLFFRAAEERARNRHGA